MRDLKIFLFSEEGMVLNGALPSRLIPTAKRVNLYRPLWEANTFKTKDLIKKLDEGKTSLNLIKKELDSDSFNRLYEFAHYLAIMLKETPNGELKIYK